MPQEETTGRLRVCGAVLRGDTILMVQHSHDGRVYWTLPGGGVEANETPQQAVIREVQEETSLTAIIVRHLYSESYANGICECYLLTVQDTQEAVLGCDPEEAHLPADERMLQQVAWLPVERMRDDGQVIQVLRALSG